MLVLFASLFASAVGVLGLVRNYLWNRSEREGLAMINGASRFIERQENRPKRPSVLKRPNVSNRGRNWRRFQRGPGQLLLIKDGIVTFGAEDEERDWTGVGHEWWRRGGYGFG